MLLSGVGWGLTKEGLKLNESKHILHLWEKFLEGDNQAAQSHLARSIYQRPCIDKDLPVTSLWSLWFNPDTSINISTGSLCPALPSFNTGQGLVSAESSKTKQHRTSKYHENTTDARALKLKVKHKMTAPPSNFAMQQHSSVTALTLHTVQILAPATPANLASLLPIPASTSSGDPTPFSVA